MRRNARQPDQVDALLRVADDTPWRIAASLDNTGDTATGRSRLGVIFQHANLFDRDHAFSAQAITSPGHENDVAILGLGYKIPLYALGDSIELAYGNSNVDSGNITTAAGDYGISGRGEFASLRYNLGLPRWQSREQRLVFELRWRAFESSVVPVGATSVGLGARIQVGHTISLRADIAHALRSAAATDDGDLRAHLQVMVLF